MALILYEARSITANLVLPSVDIVNIAWISRVCFYICSDFYFK